MKFSTLRVVPVVLLGFLLGFTAARLSRLAEPPDLNHSRSYSSRPPEPERPPPRVDVSPADETRRTTSLAKLESMETKYMGQRVRDREEILSLKDWRDFIAAVKALGLEPREVQEAIFHRLKSELQLNADTFDALMQVHLQEQSEVTCQANDAYGDRMYAMFDLEGLLRAQELVQVYGQVQLLRERVLEGYDRQYSDMLTPEQFQVVNRHLRSGFCILRDKRNEFVRIVHTGTYGLPEAPQDVSGR